MSSYYDTISSLDSSVGIIFCGRHQQPIEYLPPMAGGGGPPHITKALGGAPDSWEGVFDGRPRVSTVAALGLLRIGNWPLPAIFR
jgi:hypothetical protein